MNKKILILMLLCMVLIVGAISVSAEDNFKVTITSAPSSVVQGNNFNVNLQVINPGCGGTTCVGGNNEMKVECGMYRVDQFNQPLSIYSLFTYTSYDTSNCVVPETNVNTKIISMPVGGNAENLIYTLKAPTTDSNAQYNILCETYENCYSSGLDTQVSDIKTQSIDLTGAQATATCPDGIKNQGETSTDCGGPNCNIKCPNNYYCTTNSDCTSNYCNGGFCKTSSSGGGTINATGLQAEVISKYSDIEKGTYTVSVKLTNPTQVSIKGLLELQARPVIDKTNSIFSIIQKTETVCDPASPENTHKEFVISAEDSQVIGLTSPLPGSGTKLKDERSINLLTYTGCYFEDSQCYNDEYEKNNPDKCVQSGKPMEPWGGQAAYGGYKYLENVVYPGSVECKDNFECFDSTGEGSKCIEKKSWVGFGSITHNICVRCTADTDCYSGQKCLKHGTEESSCVSGGGETNGTGTHPSYLYSDWKDVTSDERLESMCNTKDDCKKYEDPEHPDKEFSVKCSGASIVVSTLKQDLKNSCGSLTTTTGLIKEIYGLFTKTECRWRWVKEPQGACIATEKGAFDLAWFSEDSLVAGIPNWGILGVGILILFILMKSLGGSSSGSRRY